MNALLCAAGHNLRKVLKKLRLFCPLEHPDAMALERLQPSNRHIQSPGNLKTEFLRDD